MLACACAEWTAAPDGGGVELLSHQDHMCRRHANVELVNTVDAVLQDAGASMDKVGAVLVGRGPGSFTGVRIGISTAKGLARGAGVPLYGVSTLDASAWTAWRAGVRGLLGVAADAMRGEVYPALYSVDEDGPHRLFERERVVKAAVAVEEWSSRPDCSELQITGDGLVRYAKLFEEAGLMERVLDRELWWPSGEGLLLAAASSRAMLHDQSGDPAQVLPVYTRLSDAEENERKRLGLAQSAKSEVTGVADELAGRHLQSRPMGPADAEAAAELEATCFADASHTPWSPQLLMSELASDVAAPRSWWVAHDNGELVGIAGGMAIDTDVEILDVAVAPDRRRQGIARKLLSHVSYDAQMLGCTTASLEVEANNITAIALYESLGFSRSGVRRGYYGTGAYACIMTATLPLVLPVDAASPEPTAAASVRGPCRAAAKRRRTQAFGRGLFGYGYRELCDETAVAIIDASGRMLANQVSTQIDFHARFGGVVPEIASRKHVEVIVGVVDAALEEAAASLDWRIPLPPASSPPLALRRVPVWLVRWLWALPLQRVSHLPRASRLSPSTIWKATCTPTC